MRRAVGSSAWTALLLLASCAARPCPRPCAGPAPRPTREAPRAERVVPLPPTVPPGAGPVDPPTPTPSPPVEPPAPTIVVRLEDGGFVARGEDGKVLASGPWQDDAARERLKVVLREASGPPESREPDGSSRARLLVEGKPPTTWNHVQWLMQLAADPDVRIYKVEFRVAGSR